MIIAFKNANIAIYRINYYICEDIGMTPESCHNKYEAMKYFIRSVKYFFYFAILTTAIVIILVLIGAVEGDIDSIFEGGYRAIWKIAVFFACVAAFYPKLAFIRREAAIDSDMKDIRDDLMEFFAERRYELESESEGVMTFRLRNKMARLTKMCEDRLTLTRCGDKYVLEGLRKDALHIAAALEHRFSKHLGSL